MDGGWSRLGATLRTESGRLYRTEREFAAAAGVSLRTVEKLLAGQSAAYREQTIAGVEAAVGWEPGSAERVREGMQPRRAMDVGLARLVRCWPQLDLRDRRILMAVLEALLREAV